MYQIGGLNMTIGSFTTFKQAASLSECYSINDVRVLVAQQLGVDITSITSETHLRSL